MTNGIIIIKLLVVGGFNMQCGAKCFIVEVEHPNGDRDSFPVNARTSILARKTVRLQYEDAVKIISVKKK